MPALIQEICHIPDILRLLEAVADYDQVLVHQAFVLQALDKIQIIGR